MKNILTNYSLCVLQLRTLSFSMILALAAWAATAHAQILNPNNGHYYKFVAASLTWEQASNAATSQQFMSVNGYLATITDASEESFILTNFGANFPSGFSTTPVWLGGFQPPGSPEPAGNWQWVTGELFAYTNWGPGEPNNNGNENALEIRNDGLWNDTADTRGGSGYLVEFAPVPTVVPLLNISPAGGKSILYWPTNGTSYVVQTTTNIITPNWVTASNAVTVNAVLVTNSLPIGFFQLLPVTNTPSGMALIPAGQFLMGNYLFYNSATNDPDITDANPTNVTVSAFYMDVNLVSFSQWQGVYNYATNHGYGFAYAGAGKTTNTPVETVDWFDCVKWSNARSQQAGLPPVYFTDAGFTQVFTNGDTGTTVYANWSANGYRLPTEAEWQKAARGGLSGQRFPWGNSIAEFQANYFGDISHSYDLGPNGYNVIGSIGGAAPATSPVGVFPANGYGLYDMAGNVFEWCWDWYASPYAGGTDPHGPVGPLSSRVFCGGSWKDNAGYARCANRDYAPPGGAADGVGFRCVRGL